MQRILRTTAVEDLGCIHMTWKCFYHILFLLQILFTNILTSLLFSFTNYTLNYSYNEFKHMKDKKKKKKTYFLFSIILKKKKIIVIQVFQTSIKYIYFLNNFMKIIVYKILFNIIYKVIFFFFAFLYTSFFIKIIENR